MVHGSRRDYGGRTGTSKSPALGLCSYLVTTLLVPILTSRTIVPGTNLCGRLKRGSVWPVM